MRRLRLAAGVFCAIVALSALAEAQVNTMPGQVVGAGYGVNSVGKQVPKAAPKAGKPINLPAQSAMQRPYDPNRPYDVFKGTDLSVDQLAAPVNGMGKQSLLDKLTDRLKSITGFKKATPGAQTTSTYFPSLTRRNRERAEERNWRRD